MDAHPASRAYGIGMPDRLRKKRPADLMRLAASSVADAISEEPDPYEGRTLPPIELGRT
jgi:hypothetical protein